MAIYVPPSARRRRLIVLTAVALVAGLALGYLIGRASSPDLADQVDDVQAQAEDAATALQRLPIEYEQAVTGSGGESTATITDAIESARTQLDAAFDDAIWLSADARQPSEDALDAVEKAAEDKVPADEFEAAVADAVDAINATFGLT